ncbi:MAG: serine hydrolase [Proteobacteria bacterium]|nr:serine hydrolase [Pseudomonadota bacterium]MDA1062982.1 serine hydrolase [Pseudomonadota bacterium]
MTSASRLVTLMLAVLGTGMVSRPIAMAAELQQRIDELVVAEMQTQKIPGVAVAVFTAGKPMLMKGYGFANVEHEAPVTPASVFHSASVGKQFTAVAIMLLVEDGKLGLDNSIRTYFPDAPLSWQPITIRHLLTHTSGIPDYFDVMGTNGIAPYDSRHDYAPDELRGIFYTLPLIFDAGSDFSYSNTGYALLGFLIEKVTGQFYGDLLRDRLFRPLGMPSAVVVSESDIVPGRVAGYELVNDELKNEEWYTPTNNTADGALYLSLLDYHAWDRALRERAILRDASWDEIYSAVRLNDGRLYPYGFGWNIDASQGAPWYHHSGGWLGFNLLISRYLANGITIVVLSNLDLAKSAIIVDGIAGIIGPGMAQLLPRAE